MHQPDCWIYFSARNKNVAQLRQNAILSITYMSNKTVQPKQHSVFYWKCITITQPQCLLSFPEPLTRSTACLGIAEAGNRAGTRAGSRAGSWAGARAGSWAGSCAGLGAAAVLLAVPRRTSAGWRRRWCWTGAGYPAGTTRPSGRRWQSWSWPRYRWPSPAVDKRTL